MSQFPIVSEEGLYEAVNYLASGPSGLGQNFDGFSSYTPAYLTGNTRQPWTVSTTTNAPPNWYVAPIQISSVSYLDNPGTSTSQTTLWTFSTPQSPPPFLNGMLLTGAGWTPSNYNGVDGTVVSCTNASVTLDLGESYNWPTPITTYGTLEFDAYLNGDKTKSIPISTDCNARVTVTGPTERVFVSSQLALTSGYTCSTASTFSVTVQINRYNATAYTVNGATQYSFDSPVTVGEQSKTYSVTTGSGTVDTGQNIFTTIVDQPNFGFYWYICEVVWTPLTGNAVPKLQTVGLRSLSAQVIKQ
jgi:hypothetical protein